MLSHILSKLADILSTVYGWIAATCIFVFNVLLNYISGYELNLSIVLFVTILDCVWGVWRAVKMDDYCRSDLMRDSMAKFAVYASVMLAMIGFDKICKFDTTWTFDIISALICLIEVYSIIGNALIIFPHFPLLCLFKNVLKGEIANKLGVEPDEVDKYLQNTKKKKTTKRKK